MADRPNTDLLARLAGRDSAPGDDVWTGIAATQPEHDKQDEADLAKDRKLDALIRRIHSLTGEAESEPAAEAPEAAPDASPVADAAASAFFPAEPESFAQAQLTESDVEALVVKFLLARGDATGREISDHIRLPFVLVDDLLRRMKNDRLVVHKGSAVMNDYQYELTDLGRERARRYADHCTYFGSAPVALSDYVESIKLQSLCRQHPTARDLHRAFEGLILNRRMLDRLGPAINSGRGLFLFGPPGNGKTSIAERATLCFGPTIWIPRTIGIDGEIIRVFDPVNHEEAPIAANTEILDQRKIDRRWVRIRRPTIIAGGELTMSALEVTMNKSTGICEAPLQLKSNCGTLVIDDFGRQRMSIDELLNRWIVPLEKRFDFLNLPNGKKIQVPFDQLLIFSTNLEPRDLVDEAFLRRIPYKIEAIDPSEEEFRELFQLFAGQMGFPYDASAVDHVIEKHYRAAGRPFRFCQPRDLLLQIKNHCSYQDAPLEMSSEYFDLACENYFVVM